MIQLVRSSSMVLAVVFAASCGGGSSARRDGETSATAAVGAEATRGASETVTPAQPTRTAAVSAPANAGARTNASGNEPCAFLLTAEVAGVMKTTGVTTTAVPGDPSYCTYSDSTGTVIVALTHMRSQGTATFNAVAGGLQSIAGIGERAGWEPAAATLVILKGGTVLVLAAGDTSMTNESRQDLAKQLAAIAVPRQ